MYSRPDYEIDVKEWGFADVGGDADVSAETEDTES
jgi:hypothetical protein